MDSGIGKTTRRLSLAVVMLAALVLAVGMPGQASASTCTDVGGADVGGDCTISAPVTLCPLVLTIPGDLVITGAGSISCSDPAAPITITVGGDMEMLAGSSIRAEDTVGAGSGGAITLNVDGNFTMRGGAVISSSKTAGAGDSGVAGDIRIEVGNATVNPDGLTITCATTPLGNILVENGAQILADGTGEAGAIKMFAGKNATINGLVSSQAIQTTVGRGGPITIDACCDLVIGDTGKVISQGRDFGADLVHLQGCVVNIFGLVASIGPAHGGFAGNLCNFNRPGKPLDSGACVEIWAGTTLTIDSTGTHKGEVNADTGQSGGSEGSGWIDALANGAITIRGSATAPPAGNDSTSPAFAVHANQTVGSGHGGTITVISKDSTVTAFGRALQANASTGGPNVTGGQGGHIVVLARNGVAFGTGAGPAFIEAAGDTVGGAAKGGTITAQSFNADVTGPAGSQLKVDGPGAPPASVGSVTLTGCGNQAVTYLGQVLPAATRHNVTACPGGSPPLPVPANTAVFPLANCAASCQVLQQGNKEGVKFNDLNQNGTQDAGENGIIGWTIHAFNTATMALVQTVVTVAANPLAIPPTPDGFYSFQLTPGSYTVCEALQPGWTQTAPLPGSVPPPVNETLADCAPFSAANPLLTLGPRGYNFTVVVGSVFNDNNFGNFQPPGVCPEDPLRAAKMTRVVDQTGTSHGPASVYLTVQDAYNAAVGPNEVIGLFSKTTENVVLNGAKALTITQCTNARVFAFDPLKPVWTISSSKKHLIIGPDAVGGKVGWLVSTGGHELKGLRANGASLYGIQVVGPNNKVAWNSVSGNGGDPDSAGIRVESSGNDLRGGTVSGNTGDGVQIAGGTNILQGATVQSNTGNGVFISGANNTIKGNKANKNGGAGFLTTATATGNKFSSNASNASAQGGGKENTGPEYSFATPEVDKGSNKADNVTTATKCPTLFSAGGICE